MDTKEAKVLREIGEKVQSSWTSYSAYLARKRMKDTISLIKKWYTDANIPSDIDDILRDYNQRGIIINQINYGYAYYLDELKKFKKNPYSLWDFYESVENKESLFNPPFIRYTTDEVQNTSMFLSDVFYCSMLNIEVIKMNSSILNLFDTEKRKMLADTIVKIIANGVSRDYYERTRGQLVEALQNTVNMLSDLDVLDEMRDTHNSTANRLGLKSFGIPPNTPIVDDGKIIGVDFTESSVFQLEAMLSHYSNRLEKVREEIGKGLFALRFFAKTQNLMDINPDLITDEELMGCQTKYAVWSHIYQEMLSGYQEILLESKDENPVMPTIGETYDLFVKKYENAYDLIFNTALAKNEEITEFKSEYFLFGLTNSSYRHVNYLTKERLIEDLIVLAERENINWGIMEDGIDGYRLKKHVLLGFDIPGLNTSIRLHYPIDSLRRVVHDYLKTDEVPLFVGGDDFDIVGEHTGTQFVAPITPEQKIEVKMLSKMNLKDGESKIITIDTVKESQKGKGNKSGNNANKEEVKITADTLRRAKHINCMQLPNMTEKLLAIKTDKTQKARDYLNIFTGKIRRTPRRTIHKSDTDPAGR